MKARNILIVCSSLILFAACGQQAEEGTAVTEPEVAAEPAAELASRGGGPAPSGRHEPEGIGT